MWFLKGRAARKKHRLKCSTQKRACVRAFVEKERRNTRRALHRSNVMQYCHARGKIAPETWRIPKTVSRSECDEAFGASFEKCCAVSTRVDK